MRETRLVEAAVNLDATPHMEHPGDVTAAVETFLESLYALTRLWRGKILACRAYDQLCGKHPGGRVVAGLTYCRGQAIHNLVQVVAVPPAGDHAGLFRWRWHDLAGRKTSKGGLARYYRTHVQGRDVVASSAEAVRFMADLPALTGEQVRSALGPFSSREEESDAA